MEKWAGLFLSFFLLLALSSGLFRDLPPIQKKTPSDDKRFVNYRVVPIEEEKGETDPHMLQILKEIQKKLDGWLKSLNDRIESEDISRFEVRFLEMIRNILEWVKEKVDAKVASYEKETPKTKPKSGSFQETKRIFVPPSEMG